MNWTFRMIVVVSSSGSSSQSHYCPSKRRNIPEGWNTQQDCRENLTTLYCRRPCTDSAREGHIHLFSGFGGLKVACWPLVPKWSRGSVLAFGTQVV